MFFLAQVSDLLYFFFLMFLSEAIFNASKETIYGIILLFFTLYTLVKQKAIKKIKKIDMNIFFKKRVYFFYFLFYNI